MTLQNLKDKWPLYAVMLIANILLMLCMACPSKTPSLFDSRKRITRPELQLELDTVIATAQVRMADLDQQDALRNVILKNALIMVEMGTFNPLGITTALFTFYGIGTAANSVKNIVKKKKKTP